VSRTLHTVTFTAPKTAELLATETDLTPGPLDVAGPTLATLVSPGTELAHGYHGARFPATPGYAAVFTAESVGDEVTGIKPGDRLFAMGGHRSFLCLRAADTVPVPRDLAPETAVLARLMGVSMTTLKTTAARPRDLVLVTGLGPVGNLAAQIFAAAGYDVLACDPDPRRCENARAVGLTRVLEAVPLDDDAVAGRVALHLECAGHEQAVLDGCRAVRRRGEVVLVGVPWTRRTDRSAHELLDAVFHRYAVVRSGWEWELPRHPGHFQPHSIFDNFREALDWLAEGRVRADGLIGLRDPREAARVYADLDARRDPDLFQVFDWSRI
jgi:threonine dehydrogenase-like Zn-dependent dehydrogenase